MVLNEGGEFGIEEKVYKTSALYLFYKENNYAHFGQAILLLV